MFCIKCGMMLNDSAKSCPACGTKVVLPEGFVPEQLGVQPEPVISKEPPHAPDDFDLSKANISYNGKTMLITDEPEIDLDSTMAASIPQISVPIAPEPVYQQPVYTQSATNAPSYASNIEEEIPAPKAESISAPQSSKGKSSKAAVVSIVAVIILLIVGAIIFVFLNGKNKENKTDTLTSTSISESVKNDTPTQHNSGSSISDGTDSDFQIVYSVGNVTHYLVLNPNASDYSELKQRTEFLKGNGEFEKIFISSQNNEPVSENESSLVCYYPSDVSVPFASAGRLILSESGNTKIKIETLENQEDILDTVAKSTKGCIAFVSYDTVPDRADVEFVSLDVDKIIIACDKENSRFSFENAEIGVVKNSVAHKFTDAEKDLANLPFDKFIVYDTEKEMIEALESGEIDCILTTAKRASTIKLARPETESKIEPETEDVATTKNPENDKKEEADNSSETSEASTSAPETSVSATTVQPSTHPQTKAENNE